MKLEISRYGLKIYPDQGDERDCAFIEEVLELRKNSDSIRLVREDAAGLSCIAHLKTIKDKKIELAATRIKEVLMAWLPYYEKDDSDDFLYIAKEADLQKVAEYIFEDIKAHG